MEKSVLQKKADTVKRQVSKLAKKNSELLYFLHIVMEIKNPVPNHTFNENANHLYDALGIIKELQDSFLIMCISEKKPIVSF
jgi:hypothetical protein